MDEKLACVRGEPYKVPDGVEVSGEPDCLAVIHDMWCVGPMTLAKIGFGDDGWVRCGARRATYNVKLPQVGHVEVVHRGSPAIVSRGAATIFVPEGDAVVRWGKGAQTVCVNIDRCAVDDALSAALGREVLSQIEFETTLSTTTYAAHMWTSMLAMLVELLFRSDSLLSHPLVTMPFVDCLVRGLLMIAEHPHRAALKEEAPQPGPSGHPHRDRADRSRACSAMDGFHARGRGFVSVRSLQAGFQRYTGVSPMAYLRQVRLRHAHDDLLRSDPATERVTSVASRRGFTNLSRFGALHKARYRESPSVILHRAAGSI
jgi:Helix-turn-helix domain/AraC-binding-like domain